MTGSWPRTRLKNLIQPVQNGVWGVDPAGDGNDILCVRVADFDRQRFGLKSVETVRSVPHKDRASRLLQAGDILLEKSGGTDANPVGFTVMFDGDYAAVTSNFVGRIRMRDGQVPRFWLYALAASYLTRRTQKCVRQTTGIQNLDQSAYLDEIFLVPSAEQQGTIADYLDRETARIDTLIEEQQRLIEMLRERRLAVIEHAVRHATNRTAGQRLKHVVAGVNQGWSPQCYSWPADGVEVWAVLKTGAPNGGRFRAEENKELPETETPRGATVVRCGQLIVSRASTRQLVGSAAVVDANYPRLMLSDKLYAFDIDPEQAIPEYVSMVLGTRAWRGLIELEATGSSPSMQNISQADILNLPMDLPSIDQQRVTMCAVQARTAKIDALLPEAERFIELSKERRSALITAAVTGQIDVRDDQDS